MILDTEIIMKWNSNNKIYYVDKGYTFTKMYEVFIIKVEDLNPNSNFKIKVKCDVCDKEKYLSYREYNNSISNGEYYTCSQKCSHEKSKKTCLLNYGVESPLQSSIIMDKINNTNLEKYGFERASQSDKVKNKIKNSHNSFDNLKKDTILTKVKTTNLKKYGVENVFQNIDIKNKQKQTCLNKYTVENVFQNSEIKIKIKETNKLKYGFEHHTQNKEIMNKITETQIEKYGEIWKSKVPKYNPNSIIFLDIISERLNLPIQHALNGGEKKIKKYWIDGYIQEYNICIEWDEIGHKYKKLYDENRESYIKSIIDCYFIRIIQKDFLKDIEKGISDVINKINNIRNIS